MLSRRPKLWWGLAKGEMGEGKERVRRVQDYAHPGRQVQNYAHPGLRVPRGGRILMLAVSQQSSQRPSYRFP